MIDVVAAMKSDGIVPVFHSDSLDVVRSVLGATRAAGVSTFEYTNRSPDALRLVAELIAEQETGGPWIGVGSITDAPQAEAAIDAGAVFIVGPSIDRGVADVCRDAGIPFIPGGSTLTELIEASRLGTGLVKLFPASTVGPGFLSAVLGPCPWLEVMPTGGIDPTESSMRPWFAAGAACVGLGSSLFPHELVATEQWEDLADHIRSAKDLAAEVR